MLSGFKSLLQWISIRNAFVRSFNDVSLKEIPEVSLSLIKKTLKSHKVGYEEGYSCIIIPCPNCATKTTSSKLYINKVTGSFSCASCMSFGKWDNLEVYLSGKSKRSFNDSLSITSIYEQTMLYLKEVESKTIPLKVLEDQTFVETLQNFKLPVVLKQAIDKVDVRIDSQRKNLYFPLENVDSRIIGYRVLNRNGSPHVEPVSNCPGVLTGKSTKAKDVAVLVPTLADFLILLNAKITNYIVCLPNGLFNLPVHILPSLERFSKLILWFGNDVVSWDSARSFSRKLGEKRCLFVRPNDKQLLPHLALEQDFKNTINSAETMWHKSITTFTSLRQDVLSELQNIDKVHGVKWKRYPTLNRLLKGHRRGELTVITGPTGSGKTTFVSEYSLDLAMSGVTTLWGSFEIRNVRLAKMMLQQMVALPLDKNLDKFDEFADQFEKLPIYYMTFHGQQSVKVVMEAVEHAQYVHDIAHVIIDNLQFMMGVNEDDKHMDRFWKQDIIISAFRTFATRKNCHVTLVIHPRKERDDEDLTTSSIFGGAKASQEADNILIIQDKKLSTLGRKKYLQVCKNRYSGELGIMPLEFDKGALSFMQKKKKLNEKTETKVLPETPIINDV